MIDEIEDLLKMFEKSEISEMSIEKKGLKISFKKQGTRPSPPTLGEKAPFQEESPEERIIKSEHVGFIDVTGMVGDGALVKKGDVLMKVLVLGTPCEIEAPYQGRIKYRQELRDRIKEVSPRKRWKRPKEIKCSVDYGLKLFEIESIEPLEELPEIQPARRGPRIQTLRQEIKDLKEKLKEAFKRGNA